MVDATCCQRNMKNHLCFGVGATAKNPSFISWKCVNGECNECVVEKNWE